MGYIYKITNLINQKVYIGLTYRTIEIRWREHKSRAFNNWPGYLYNSIRKHGIQNFFIEQIDIGFDEELKIKEQYWINYYDSANPKKGYNLTLGGDGNLKIDYNEVYNLWDNGFSIADISNELQIDRHTVKDILKEYKNFSEEEGLKRGSGRKSTSVNQYSLQGKYITTFSSLIEAERTTNISYSNISLCCNLKLKTAGNYQWRYYNGNIKDISPINKRYSCKRPVAQYDLNNNFIQSFNSLIEAARSLPEITNPQSVANQIGQVCQGNRKTCRNYIWEYV